MSVQLQYPQLFSELGERLSLVTVFALTVRFEWPDLSLIITSGLLEALVQLYTPVDHHCYSCGGGGGGGSGGAVGAAGGSGAFDYQGNASRNASSHHQLPSPIQLLPRAAYTLFQIITVLSG